MKPKMTDPIREAIDTLDIGCEDLENPPEYSEMRDVIMTAMSQLRAMQNNPAIAMSACTDNNASLNEQAEPMDASERGDFIQILEAALNALNGDVGDWIDFAEQYDVTPHEVRNEAAKKYFDLCKMNLKGDK